MSCVLRVSGERFDVDAYLRSSRFEPVVVWRKGERSEGDDSIAVSSGFNVEVSSAGLRDLDTQMRDAVQFLRDYGQELAALARAPNVEHAGIDFAVAWRQECASHSDHVPAAVVTEAARFGLYIEVSHYPASDAEQE